MGWGGCGGTEQEVKGDFRATATHRPALPHPLYTPLPSAPMPPPQLSLGCCSVGLCPGSCPGSSAVMGRVVVVSDPGPACWMLLLLALHAPRAGSPHSRMNCRALERLRTWGTAVRVRGCWGPLPPPHSLESAAPTSQEVELPRVPPPIHTHCTTSSYTSAHQGQTSDQDQHQQNTSQRDTLSNKWMFIFL